MADTVVAMRNLEKAYAELRSFLALPVQNQRDKAGIIQAFEFTFELFWKIFQKLAPEAGLEAASPREALQAALKLRLIPPVDASAWAQMLRDRNLTSHTYQVALANEVFGRISASYSRCFADTLALLRGLATAGPDADTR